MVFEHFQQIYCKKHRFCNVFCNVNAKYQGKPVVFQYVQQYIAKRKGVFNVFFQSEYEKLRNTYGFQHVQQNITKSMGFLMFFCNLSAAKTKENRWCFNIFSKLLQKTQVL